MTEFSNLGAKENDNAMNTYKNMKNKSLFVGQVRSVWLFYISDTYEISWKYPKSTPKTRMRTLS